MNRIKKPLRILLTLIAATQIAACSKTVQWEEEVPLNTGETIWVKRHVTYKIKGGGDNPMDLAYRPDWTETLEFTWQGKKYAYTGDAAIMLVAISPTTKRPVLVAMKSIYSQSRSMDRLCVKPFYDQMEVNSSKWEWQFLPKIEPWTFNLPRNVMAHRSDKMSEVKSRYSLADRQQRDVNLARDNPPATYIDPNYQPEFCVGRQK